METQSSQQNITRDIGELSSDEKVSHYLYSLSFCADETDVGAEEELLVETCVG